MGLFHREGDRSMGSEPAWFVWATQVSHSPRDLVFSAQGICRYLPGGVPVGTNEVS